MKPMPYNTFWTLANKLSHQRHDLSYHPCCDTWTKSFCKARLTHKETITWRKLIASLDSDIKDKKDALKLKLIQDKCKVNVVLNQPCSAQSSHFIDNELTHQQHNLDLSSEVIQANLELQQDLQNGQTPDHSMPDCSMLYLTRFQSREPLFRSAT